MLRFSGFRLLLVPMVLLLATPLAHAAEEDANPEEAVIRAAIAAYVEAFNRHDAGAVAGHWTEQGEFITPAGKALKGRAQLEEEFAAYFEEAKDVKLEIDEPAIEFLSPGVATEHGSARILRPDAEPQETDYVAIHVKTADGWKMDSVQEQERVEPLSHYEHLQELEWMIGEWVDSDENATVEAVCRWTTNRNFMTRSFKIYVEDRIDMEGTQIIGWDAANETIRSWVFNSEGGFGVAAWEKNGDRWIIRGLNVLPDGRRGSTTVLLQPLDGDSFTIQTIGRQVGGELLPNIDPVKVVRKPN